MIGLILGWVALLLIIGLNLNCAVNGYMIIPIALFIFDLGFNVGRR